MNPQNNNQLSTLLFDNMQKQLNLVSEFNKFLNQIKQVITQDDSAQLNQLLSQPPVDINEIEKMRQQQKDLLSQHGYEDSDTGLKVYIRDNGQPALKELHQSLIKQIKQLEKALLINGLIIRKSQHRVRQTLQILSGHGVSEKAVTYSRHGNTEQSEDSKRRIALA